MEQEHVERVRRAGRSIIEYLAAHSTLTTDGRHFEDRTEMLTEDLGTEVPLEIRVNYHRFFKQGEELRRLIVSATPTRLGQCGYRWEEKRTCATQEPLGDELTGRCTSFRIITSLGDLPVTFCAYEHEPIVIVDPRTRAITIDKNTISQLAEKNSSAVDIQSACLPERIAARFTDD